MCSIVMGQCLIGTCESHSCGERWTCRQPRWAQKTMSCAKVQSLSGTLSCRSCLGEPTYRRSAEALLVHCSKGPF